MSNWYPAYSEYNNSDVAWIEKYPSHWKCSKVKHYLEKLIAGGTPESGNTDYWIDSGEGTPWVSIADITLNPDVSTTKKDVTDAGIKAKNLKILPKGTILYSIFASLGKVGEAKVRLTTNQAILGLVPNKKLNKELFKYWLQSVEAHLGLLSSSNTQDNLNAEKVGNLPILLPPVEEQQTIVAFLNYETARIDRLIAKQQRLIDLLKEKRQAVISHAVIKGLNPNASMKDSCVEWLGQVPGHWNIPKLFYVTSRIGDGLHSTPIYQEGTGYFFVNGNNLNNGNITVGSTAKEVPVEEYQAHYISLDGRSVLLSINGTIGNVALYRNEPIILGKSAAYINCKAMLSPDYLRWYLTTDQAKLYYKLEATGTTIYNLSLGSIRNMKVLLPPTHEQKTIAQFCSASYLKYEQLISAAIKKMSILQERRIALISAAVTGKIDLRGWTPPAEEAAA
ncbi:restriction endonuclease subunit S [Aeromonas caviae]|uniref:restriction endonuclease subunit S n=1 Tax=Aeromonas caviae TaxID=648 RepID=UPI002B488AB2|nr:restriction endonuclease subunit S [Aeromonas caviae]